MKVSIAYANEDSQLWRELDTQDHATVEDVINESGLLETFTIDLSTQKVGIFGKFVKLNDTVTEGDRIEIYRPITKVLDDEDDDED